MPSNLGNSLFQLRSPEAGFQAELLLFGGTIGVVFEDEIDKERPPFFEINYDKISYLVLQCGMERRSGLGMTISPSGFTFVTHVL